MALNLGFGLGGLSPLGLCGMYLNDLNFSDKFSDILGWLNSASPKGGV